jgi:hypothetical protein
MYHVSWVFFTNETEQVRISPSYRTGRGILFKIGKILDNNETKYMTIADKGM